MMSKRSPLFSRILFFISVFIIFFSIYPWSISEFLKNQIETTTDDKKNNIRIFPKELYDFAQEAENFSVKKDSIVFISKDGKGEKEFFLLSYYLFPRKIYWISNPAPGPINWWMENDLSFQNISVFVDKYKISWIIAYDYDFDPSIYSNWEASIAKKNNFALYKKV